MRDLEDALTYPMEDEDWLITVAIGGVLTFLGFLLVPIVLINGYLVGVIRAATDGAPEPPAFEDWEDLLIDGVQATVIGFVYMLVPAIVGTVTVGGAILAFLTGSQFGAAAGFGGLLAGLFLTLVLALVFGYVAGAALVNFAREDELAAGFDISTLSSVVLDANYAIPWLIAAGVLIGAGIVNSILATIPLLGAFAGAFVMFYATVVAITLLADGFDDATGASATGFEAEEPSPEI